MSTLALPAFAGAAPDAEDNFKIEALPPHLAALVQQNRKVLDDAGLNAAPRQAFYALKLWPPDYRTLRVCFFGGSSETRAKIAAIASRWTKGDIGLELDFGDPSDPRQCGADNGETNQIRIGFNDVGYWSLVGMDSITAESTNEPSMNLEGFDRGGIDDGEFDKVVLHEFGHALGLEHEHQNPYSKCEAEFDWPYLYKRLSRGPNNWSKATVNVNMQVLGEDGLVMQDFDHNSIMLYTFPARFYLKRAGSLCFQKEDNLTLSDDDKRVAAYMYPFGVAIASARFEERKATLTKSLENSDASSKAKSDAQALLDQYFAPAAAKD